MKKAFLSGLIRGPGGLARLMPIAIPMIISHVFDMVMTFVDRLFLSYVSPVAMASCMTGGLTAFLFAYVAFGLVAYCSTLVAHRFGAGKLKECPVVVMQGVWISLLTYPFILLMGSKGINIFAWMGHTPEQVALESAYFRIMIVASIFGLLRAAFSGFFAGLGKTHVIMYGNAGALVVNITGNYVLIFGKWGAPALGITGAALGTAIASGFMMLFMAVAFFIQIRKKAFRPERLFVFDASVCRQLIRYGTPSGFDGFVSTAGFAAIVLMIHSMGEDVAAAVTMVYNWDLMSFFPIVGIQNAVATLVGMNMGAHNIKGARQTVRSGMTIMFLHTSLVALVFIIFPRTLLIPFAKQASASVITLAVPMMRIASLYLTTDGISLIFAGALRGAGDTFWTMIIRVIFNIFMVAACWVAIYPLQLGPLGVWLTICLTITVAAIAYYLRYRQGHWERMDLSSARQA